MRPVLYYLVSLHLEAILHARKRDMPRQDPAGRSAVTTVYREHRRRSRLLATRRAARLATLAVVLGYAAYRFGAAEPVGETGLLVVLLTVVGIIAWAVALVFDFRVRDCHMRSRVLMVRMESLRRLVDTVPDAADPERDEPAS
jgi:hypothetical protein